MSFSPDSQRSKCSYDDENFETTEESLLVDGKSSPVVLGRQESVFLAESSPSSVEESFRHEQNSQQELSGASISEGLETILSESIAESENITEECGYSGQFESLASEDSEEAKEELCTKLDEITTEEEKNEGQDSFIEKKLALLSSGSKTLIYEKKDDSKMKDDSDEMSNFCSGKLKMMAMKKHNTNQECPEQTVKTVVRPVDQPVAGNKRKIESLKIENLMKKMEKKKQKDFHNPRQCSECRSMKSDIAKNTFLKRKLEIVKRAEFEDRLQTHLYQKDSATLIAEIVNCCPKPTASASKVWEKLLHREGNK